MPESLNSALQASVIDLMPSSGSMRIVWFSVKTTAKLIRVGWFVYNNVTLHRTANVSSLVVGYTLEGAVQQFVKSKKMRDVVQAITISAFCVLMLEKAAMQLTHLKEDFNTIQRFFTGKKIVYVQQSKQNQMKDGIYRPASQKSYLIKWMTFKKFSSATIDVPCRIFMAAMYILDAKSALTSTHTRDEQAKVILYSAQVWNSFAYNIDLTYDKLQTHHIILKRLLEHMPLPGSIKKMIDAFMTAAENEELVEKVKKTEAVVLAPFVAVGEAAEMLVEGGKKICHVFLSRANLLSRVPPSLIPNIDSTYEFNNPSEKRFITPPKWKKIILKKKIKKGKKKKRDVTSAAQTFIQKKLSYTQKTFKTITAAISNPSKFVSHYAVPRLQKMQQLMITRGESSKPLVKTGEKKHLLLMEAQILN